MHGRVGAGPLGPDGQPLPRARDGAVLGLLLLALVLLACSWARIEGYQLADSVEYMERAQSLARGEVQDPAGGLRSFGFSVLLAPLFWVQDRLGIWSEPSSVVLVRGLQVLFGLWLVLACTRLGARLGGRRAGLVAGLLVACNPIFLQYGVSPVSGLASACFVALGLDALLVRGSARRALIGGLWLGVGFLMAYQTLLVAAPILLFVTLRERRHGPRNRLAMLGGFGLCVLAQVVLDRLTWGEWGVSLVNYVISNSSGVIVTALLRLGLDEAAAWTYDRFMALQGLSMDPSAGGEARQLQPRSYYLLEIRSMLSVPALALLALGCVSALRRTGQAGWILVLTLGLNVLAMSLKGAKSFRLWLPLLPLIAPLCGLGFDALLGVRAARARHLRRLVGLGVVAGSMVLGVRTLLALDVRQYGVYWHAMARVNELRQGGAEDPALVSSAYHWAVWARAGPGIELVKLPHHLDQWHAKHMNDERRAATLERLAELDWFLVHAPVLDQDRALFDLVNERFVVEDVVWDEGTHPALGPVYVLRTRRSRPEGRRLTESLPPEDPHEYRRRLGLDRTLPAPMDFLGKSAGGEGFDVRMTLLGFEYETLPGSDIGWITYHWTAATEMPEDYWVIDRLTPPNGAHAWQNNHAFAHGFRPSSEWVPGHILRESYPVLLGELPFTDRFQPLGGPYRRGDLVPLELWMTIVDYDEQGAYRSSLRPAQSGAPRPLDLSAPTLLPGDRNRSAEGFVVSLDQLARLASFLAPIHERHRWPDDGRGDPP